MPFLILMGLNLMGLILMGLIVAGTPARAEQSAAPALPLWEVGVGAGAGWLPDYPAADQGRVRALALPVIRYRGEFLRSDERGLLRGRLMRNRDLELDVSFAGAFPAASQDNDARRGMPDLDWMGEVGPRLLWTLARSPDGAPAVQVDIPLRAVLSTDFRSGVRHEGWVFHPTASWTTRDMVGSGVTLRLSGGPMLADRALADTFYGVAPAFATAARPAWRGRAGYMGSTLAVTASRPLTDRVTLLGRVEGRSHHGAANRASPLHRSDTGISAGLALTVTLARSTTLVPADR